MKDTFTEMILKAHKQSFHAAFEVAVRTGTVLVFNRNGKLYKLNHPISMNSFQ